MAAQLLTRSFTSFCPGSTSDHLWVLDKTLPSVILPHPLLVTPDLI